MIAMNNTAKIIVGAIISAVGFLYALFATFYLLWGRAASVRPWSAGEWTFAIILLSAPLFFTLCLVYRCVGSSLKHTALAELVGIVGCLLWFAATFYSGREPQTLLEQGTPLVETTNRIERVPDLPLRYPAVGTEKPDGKFAPIMFLTTHDSGNGYKEPFSTIGPKVETPGIKIFRGTNDLASENYFLGEFKIVNYGKIKQPMELWLFFSVDEKSQLFVRARAVDKTHNDALKLKRVSK
jgi:hypothetical protein